MKRVSGLLLGVAAVAAFLGCGGGGGGAGSADVAGSSDVVFGPNLSGKSALFFTTKELEAPDTDSQLNSTTKNLYNVFRWVPDAPVGYNTFTLHYSASVASAFPLTVGDDLYLVVMNSSNPHILKMSSPGGWMGYFDAGAIEKTEYLPTGVSYIHDFAICGTEIYYKKGGVVWKRSFGLGEMTSKDENLTWVADVGLDRTIHVVNSNLFAFGGGVVRVYALSSGQY